MGRREAFYDLCAHKTPDRVLLDLCGCPLSGLTPEAEKRLFEHLGLTGERETCREKMLTMLDIDTRGVGDILTPEKSVYKRISDAAYIDEWGVERRYTGLYWDIVNSPLAGATVEDLESYPWPDADSVSDEAIAAIARRAKALHEQTDYVVCASHPVYGVFELGCWMCGFEDFMMKMALDEDFVRRFFEIVLKYQKRVIEKYYPPLAPYIDYTSSGDDFATQASLFVSPDMFEELVAPYFKARIDYTRQFTDAKYLHHSCGNVSRLIPTLCACGVEILNPIQPTGPDMAPTKLKAQYGANVVFHGGLDTQSTLVMGTEEDVERAVNALLDAMQPGGGYIFAAAHNLQADVSPELIVRMFRAARAWRVGGKDAV